jgi:hypothetical protein
VDTHWNSFSKNNELGEVCVQLGTLDYLISLLVYESRSCIQIIYSPKHKLVPSCKKSELDHHFFLMQECYNYLMQLFLSCAESQIVKIRIEINNHTNQAFIVISLYIYSQLWSNLNRNLKILLKHNTRKEYSSKYCIRQTSPKTMSKCVKKSVHIIHVVYHFTFDFRSLITSAIVLCFGNLIIIT